MDTIAAQAGAGRAVPATGGEPVQLAQFARLLRRHLWLIAICAVLAAAGAFAYARTLPKTYTANTAITVEGDRFAIPELQGALRNDSAPDPMPWVRTEVQALTSRALVTSVTDRLDLAAVPEFNPALRPPTLTQQARDLVTGWMRTVLPPGPADAPVPGPNEAVLASVMKALGVFQDNRSLVIQLSFTSEDPRLAASFINELVTEYVQTRARRRGEANQGANTVITQRIAEVRGDLDKIEQQMRDLRSRNEMVAVRAGGVGQQQVEELTTAAARATLDRSQLEVTYQRAQAAAAQGSSDMLAAVLNSPTISRMRDQAAQASQRVAELSTRYGAGYPGVRSANAELASAQRQIGEEAARIIASLGAQLRVAREQEADVKRQLDAARSSGVQSENVRAQLDELQQEANGRRALYQTLLERTQQTVSQPAASETPDVRVISPAVPPGSPSGPSTKMAALMGGAGGMLFGGLIALARLRSVDALESAGQVTSVTGLPVLATLPRRLVRAGRGVLANQGAESGGQVPMGADAEAMRALRGRLRFAGRTGTPRSALFVPAADGALSAAAIAAIAACFARVAAADGERVLLIEGDLTVPRLGEILDRRDSGREPGRGCLGAVLAGEDWREAVDADRQPGLDLLLAERAPAKGGVRAGQALLRGVHFQNLLVEAREDYDLVVLSAPHAEQAEAATLAQRADAVVLVIDGLAGRAATREAAARLGAASRTPLVAVLLSQT